MLPMNQCANLQVQLETMMISSVVENTDGHNRQLEGYKTLLQKRQSMMDSLVKRMANIEAIEQQVEELEAQQRQSNAVLTFIEGGANDACLSKPDHLVREFEKREQGLQESHVAIEQATKEINGLQNEIAGALCARLREGQTTLKERKAQLQIESNQYANISQQRGQIDNDALRQQIRNITEQCAAKKAETVRCDDNHKKEQQQLQELHTEKQQCQDQTVAQKRQLQQSKQTKANKLKQNQWTSPNVVENICREKSEIEQSCAAKQVELEQLKARRAEMDTRLSDKRAEVARAEDCTLNETAQETQLGQDVAALLASIAFNIDAEKKCKTTMGLSLEREESFLKVTNELVAEHSKLKGSMTAGKQELQEKKARLLQLESQNEKLAELLTASSARKQEQMNTEQETLKKDLKNVEKEVVSKQKALAKKVKARKVKTPMLSVILTELKDKKKSLQAELNSLSTSQASAKHVEAVDALAAKVEQARAAHEIKKGAEMTLHTTQIQALEAQCCPQKAPSAMTHTFSPNQRRRHNSNPLQRRYSTDGEKENSKLLSQDEMNALMVSNKKKQDSEFEVAVNENMKLESTVNGLLAKVASLMAMLQDVQA